MHVVCRFRKCGFPADDSNAYGLLDVPAVRAFAGENDATTVDKCYLDRTSRFPSKLGSNLHLAIRPNLSRSAVFKIVRGLTVCLSVSLVLGRALVRTGGAETRGLARA